MFDFSNPLTEIQGSVYKSHILNPFLCEVQVGFALLGINWSPGATWHSALCRASLFGGAGQERKQLNAELAINASWEPKPSHNKITVTTVIITARSSCHPRGESKWRLNRRNEISTRRAIGLFKCDILGNRRELRTLATGLESKETGCNRKKVLKTYFRIQEGLAGGQVYWIPMWSG